MGYGHECVHPLASCRPRRDPPQALPEWASDTDSGCSKRRSRGGTRALRGYPAISECEGTELVVLDPDEGAVQLAIQSDMGAETAIEHAGEAAVIAYAQAHGYTAIIDEREAISQALERLVIARDSMWLACEALQVLDDVSRAAVERIVDDLLATGMWLPVKSGASLIAWAYEEGYMRGSS